MFLSGIGRRKCRDVVAISKRFKHKESVRIGCSSGFWGDTPTAVPQLLYGGKVEYIVADYLSEVTMSLLVAARSKNPQLGFTPDFLESIAPHLKEIKRQGIRIVTNGGGINPKACVEMLQSLAKKQGVEFQIATVTGDDLMPKREELMSAQVKEMFSGKAFPSSVNSMNAYYGAGPIVKALEMGAEIVVTGRSTDSALALAPAMHELGWSPEQFDQMAAGSLAGHLIECGCQCTGGNFTDWTKVPDFDKLGFPIAEVRQDGSMLITKAPGTGGILSVGSVGEQLLYEVGDPAAYVLPDVIADFSNVQMKETEGGVEVWGAKGRAPTPTYKISATYLDGFKATCVVNFCGGDSAAKGRVMAESILKRTRRIFSKLNIPDFDSVHVQMLGAEESFGPDHSKHTREAVLWFAVQHKDKKALQIWAKEIAACGTGGTPGITAVVGGRPKPSPCLKLFSFLHPKSQMDATVTLDSGASETYKAPEFEASEEKTSDENVSHDQTLLTGDHTYRLEDLAYMRSGDKGNSCNVGVIARHPAFLPYIRSALSQQNVGHHFRHMIQDGGKVHRYEVPGIHGLNFVLESSLGGGGIASIRPDPLGKAFGQILGELKLENLPSKEQMINAAT
eukprot:TRINITY_DN5923_c0_g1_i1.p1 TRINITY_DN5923_c0_g1~~TRINITY_DN5923_c0_g1_i1.p1  ORF type:complete len:620 (-),score=121.10 TRINITY_DN5923_c0_g1_i1:453-2312(-)